MNNWKSDRIGSAVRGENPTVLAKMKSGYAVIADPQFLPGYCVLLGFPQVNSLNDLTLEQRKYFLLDMSLLGDAISTVCKPIRVNYEILGNSDAFLHAHVIPRFDWEDDVIKKQPIWVYPKENWSLEQYQFSEEKHGELKNYLSSVLEKLMKENY